MNRITQAVLCEFRLQLQRLGMTKYGMSLRKSPHFHLNFQTHVFRSHGQSNLTSFHHCVELRFSHAQSCRALKCGSRFHCMIPNLRQQSRRAFSRDWVLVTLSTCSCRRNRIVHLWVSRPDTVLHASVEKVEFSRFTHPLGQICCCSCKVWCLLGQIRKSHARRSVSCCILFLQN